MLLLFRCCRANSSQSAIIGANIFLIAQVVKNGGIDLFQRDGVELLSNFF